MRSSDKMRGALGRLAIFAVVMLLASLVIVSPMSGAATKKCPNTCGKLIKEKTDEPVDESYLIKYVPVCSIKINGVKHKKYAVKERTCWWILPYKECHHNEYCTVTKKCANIDTFPSEYAQYVSCQGWRTTGYILDEDLPI